MPRQRIVLSIVCLAALSAVLLLAGCNIIGLFADAIPKTVDAKYIPPKTPILVLVENQRNPGALVAEADQLAGFIMDDLAAYKTAPLIGLKKLYELRDNEKNIDKMTITQIGKAVGAQQVLYVDLLRFSEGEAGVSMRSRLDATVHLVDVKTSVTTFPAIGQPNWPIAMETPIDIVVTDANVQAVRESVLRSAGTEIGRLFHDYRVQ